LWEGIKEMSEDDVIKGRFREGFMWGVATASYQIEGCSTICAEHV